MATHRIRVRGMGLGLVALGLAGCPPADPSPGATTSASASPGPSASASAVGSAQTGPVVKGAPFVSERVARVINPRNEQPYSGPTGTLRGVVRVRGDEPPPQTHDVPTGCGQAAATYGKLFRVGQDDTLADVLVAITDYGAFVPPTVNHQRITIEECAFSTRTVALTLGQHLEIENRDATRSYLPVLRGTRTAAKMVAVPQGTVKLYAQKPSRYRLVDEMGRPFMSAEVFVLKYATLDVTGLDGRYEIARIPVGEVQVSAMLPAAGLKTVNQRLEIKPGDNTLDLIIEFDATKDVPAPPPSTSASVTASPTATAAPKSK